MAEATAFASFEEFWPFYVGEHRDPTNRALHYLGTSLAIGTVTAAVVTWNPMWLLATPVVGYAPAWIGHYVIEGNRPATFAHPVWSLRGDLRMLKLALQGKMAAEVARVIAAGDHANDAAPDVRTSPVQTAGATPGAQSVTGENGVAHHVPAHGA